MGKDIADARHFALAQGYAWGRQDAALNALPPEDVDSRVKLRDTGAATAFAVAYAAHCAAYAAERIGSMHNVASAYDMFVRGETLPVEAVKRPWQADCEYCQRYSRACGRHSVPVLSDSFGHRINPVG